MIAVSALVTPLADCIGSVGDGRTDPKHPTRVLGSPVLRGWLQWQRRHRCASTLYGVIEIRDSITHREREVLPGYGEGCLGYGEGLG